MNNEDKAEWVACGIGPCAAEEGHAGTCAQASGLDVFTENAKDAAYDAGRADAVRDFLVLDELFLRMRDRVAGWNERPVAVMFRRGETAFEWAATNVRRVAAGEAPLDPPAPSEVPS